MTRYLHRHTALALYTTAVEHARDAYLAENHCRCGALTGPDPTRRGITCQDCKKEAT